jgi:hypothetical protein
MVGLIVSVLLIVLGKAVADIVSNEVHWKKSVFSRCDDHGFYGAKEFSSARKYKYKDKWYGYLFQTNLVWVTDLWHFANSVQRVGIYIGLLSALTIDAFDFCGPLVIILCYAAANIILFHIAYHYLLRNNFWKGM